MKSFDLLAIREYFPSIENPVATLWVYDQLKEIQKFGIDSLVLSPTPIVPNFLQFLLGRKNNWKIKPSNKIENYLGVNVVRPPYIKLPGNWFTDYNLKIKTKCINNISNILDFKLIHAHFGQDGICSIPIKIQKNVPLITSFYGCDLGSEKERLRKYYQQLAKVGDLFLVLSKDMEKDLIDLNFPQERIIVHHLGVDIRKFKELDNSEKEKNVFVFTVVASFNENKGIHYVIEAFKEFIKGKDKNKYQLRIIGNGSYYKELFNRADKYQNIVFINNFMSDNPRETVLNEMQKADVFLLTSVIMPNGDKEGTPVVLMEAQACGKPCISTYHAGIPELVINGVTGILTEERNIQQIRSAMELLRQNKSLRMQMGKEARKHIEQNFNNDIQIERLNNIYRKLLNT